VGCWRGHAVAAAFRPPPTTGAPFGGFKNSGTGRDKSLHTLDGYTGLKTTWINPTRSDMKIAFTGLGDIGPHMARNLLVNGHRLVVNDLRKEAAEVTAHVA
jgi:6-phosphogluconate dehydrogenase-like protein